MHTVVAKKRFSQNFLHDVHYQQKILAACEISSHDEIIEIGCGTGALTQGLIASGARIHGVELDPDMIEILKTKFSGVPNFTLYHADFLKWPFPDFANPVKVIGNLPYAVSSPILFKLMEHSEKIQTATVMLQKEVAQRIAGKPNSKDYGILSVFCQLHSDVKKLFDVPSSAFTPRPMVVSSILQMKFKPLPDELSDYENFRSLVKTAFNQRRKMLRNSIAGFLQGGESPVSLELRPEALGVKEFVRLSNFLVGSEE